MRKTEVILMTGALLVLLFISSCKHEPLETPAALIAANNNGSGGTNNNNNNNNNNNSGTPCDPNTVYFETQILPIINSNCATSGCHNSTDLADRIQFTSYADVMSYGEITPYSLSGELWEVINETDPRKVMPRPPQAPLTQDQIDLIQTWIMQGAQNLTCTQFTCDSTNVSYTSKVQPLIFAKCKGCHSGANPAAGVLLNSYNTIVASANAGTLMGTITWAPGYHKMPKNGQKLSDCEIGMIRNWMTEGMQNN